MSLGWVPRSLALSNACCSPQNDPSFVSGLTIGDGGLLPYLHKDRLYLPVTSGSGNAQRTSNASKETGLCSTSCVVNVLSFPLFAPRERFTQTAETWRVGQ